MAVPSSSPLVVDRYAIYREIAAGGMATVHLARLMGPAGFTRTVAVKRLLPHLTRDENFSAMLIDEARLAARIRHPNVVSTLDVIATEGELLLVMDYVHGESLSKLWRRANDRGERIPVPIAAAILIDALHGLHAAHEATAEDGTPLNLVHRDVSPQNMLVGADGITRIADFGIAKALGRAQVTRDRTVKGKLSYMAPEQIRLETVTRTTDVFAASIVLWEVLSGKRLFQGDNDAQLVHQVLTAEIPPVTQLAPGIPAEFDAVLRRGLARDPKERFPTARDMALAIERCVPAVRASEIGAWVELIASDSLSSRSQVVSSIERGVELLESAQTQLSGPLGPTEVNAYGETVARTGGISAPVSWSRSNIDVPSQIEQGTRPVPMRPPPSSESTQPSAPELRRRAPLLLIALGLLIPLIGAAIFMSMRQSNRVDATAESAAAAQDAAVEAATLTTTPAASSAPVSAPPASAEAAASAAASAVLSAIPLATSAPKRAPKTAPQPRGNRVPKAAAQCDPPYSIDAQGRRIFKLECM